MYLYVSYWLSLLCEKFKYYLKFIRINYCHYQFFSCFLLDFSIFDDAVILSVKIIKCRRRKREKQNIRVRNKPCLFTEVLVFLFRFAYMPSFPSFDKALVVKIYLHIKLYEFIIVIVSKKCKEHIFDYCGHIIVNMALTSVVVITLRRVLVA